MKRSFGILATLLIGFIFGMAVPFAMAHDEEDCPVCPVCPEEDDPIIEFGRDKPLIVQGSEEDAAIKKALEAIQAADDQEGAYQEQMQVQETMAAEEAE